MSRSLIIIRNQSDRDRAIDLAESVPFGSRVEIKGAKRTTDQNKKFWAMLQDISEQLPWHGQWLSAEDWKLLVLDALKRELRLVPAIDGNGYISLGRSSSDLTIEEMSDCIELMHAFGANHGVIFHDPSSDIPLRSGSLKMEGAGVTTGHRDIGSTSSLEVA